MSVVPADRSYELTEALSALIAQQPFFAVYLLDMMRIEESECVPTAGTNGRTIYVNPKWYNKMGTQERVFVLCHEVLHGIMQHPERGQLYKDRGVGPDLKEWSHKRWNIAADYIINDTLVKGNVGKPPAEGLFNPNFGKDDLCDEVYEKIPEDDDDEGWDSHLPPDPNNPAPSQAQVQRALKSAEAAAKAQGKMPSSLQRIVDDICEPQVTWQEYLRKTIITMAGKDQCTWARPNRRKLAVAPHVYWPGRAGSVTGPIACEIDTSGSISDKELATFMSELHGIFSDAPPEKLYLMYVDAARHGDIIEIDDTNQLLEARKKAGGGGGTDMTVIFKEIEENQLPVDMAIIFTDGYTPFGEDPGYEVIWCITNDSIKAPFGTTINIKIAH
jgi:predicted metal-dependent peptidase